VILALGFDLRRSGTTPGLTGTPWPSRPLGLIQIDIDPPNLGHYPAEFPILLRKASLRYLNDCCSHGQSTITPAARGVAEPLNHAADDWQNYQSGLRCSDQMPLRPERLKLRACSRAVPENAIVAAMSGDHNGIFNCSTR